MTLFVDTSVWSLALRRDAPPDVPEISALAAAVQGGQTLCTTGLVLQELLQGFAGPRDGDLIVERLAALPMLVPRRRDHVEAATLRNVCRRAGVQIGTIDALIAQLCIAHDLVLLTTDRDFSRIAEVQPLRIWGAARA